MPDSHPVYRRPETDSPIIQACLELAEEAHAAHKDGTPQVRDKAHVTLPYKTHLYAAYNILRAHGVKEPVILGATLLHDAIEQGIRGTGTQTNLEITLSNRIEAKLMQADPGLAEEKYRASAANHAMEIANLVNQVSNDDAKAKQDKMLYQVDKARTMSWDAQKIKIADIAASLFDDILHQPNRPKHQLVDFARRGWNVAKICSEQAPELFNFVRALYIDARTVYEDPSKRPTPQTVSIAQYQERARALIQAEYEHEQYTTPKKWVDIDKAGAGTRRHAQKLTGILSVGLDRQGKVVAFRIIPPDVNPFLGLSQDNAVSQENDRILYQLLDEIADYKQGQKSGHNFAIVEAQGTYGNLHTARKVTLHWPMNANEFIEKAQRAGALHDKEKEVQLGGGRTHTQPGDRAFISEIKRISQGLGQEAAEELGKGGAFRVD